MQLHLSTQWNWIRLSWSQLAGSERTDKNVLRSLNFFYSLLTVVSVCSAIVVHGLTCECLHITFLYPGECLFWDHCLFMTVAMNQLSIELTFCQLMLSLCSSSPEFLSHCFTLHVAMIDLSACWCFRMHRFWFRLLHLPMFCWPSVAEFWIMSSVICHLFFHHFHIFAIKVTFVYIFFMFLSYFYPAFSTFLELSKMFALLHLHYFHRWWLFSLTWNLLLINFQVRNEDSIYVSGELYTNPNDFVSQVNKQLFYSGIYSSRLKFTRALPRELPIWCKDEVCYSDFVQTLTSSATALSIGRVVWVFPGWGYVDPFLEFQKVGDKQHKILKDQ